MFLGGGGEPLALRERNFVWNIGRKISGRQKITRTHLLLLFATLIIIASKLVL